MDMTEQERASIKKMVDDAATRLGEHVDALQIFVTFHDGESNDTLSYECGRGNFYTRQGHVDEWLIMQREYQRLHAQKKDAEE